MKIGIVTFEFNYNYGAILQATALQDILQELGHDVEIVNRGWKNDIKEKKQGFRYYISSLLGKYYTLRDINKYKKKHFNLSRKVNDENEIKELFNEYDTIILGSDQIWNSECIKDMGLYYYGIHANHKRTRIIAYAPSFGHNNFCASPEIKEKLSNLFNKYTAISTREEDGIHILRNIFNIRNAVRVLDPTMLHNANYYRELANIKNKKNMNKTLVYYFLDKSDKKLNLVYKLATELGLRPINININGESTESKFNIIQKIKSLKYPSIETWLEEISNANFIITDSFHGTVFSIIFNKQFITFGNKKRGNSRFLNLLSMFDLEKNLLLTPEININNIPHIDYGPINRKLQTLQQESMNFIYNSLT